MIPDLSAGEIGARTAAVVAPVILGTAALGGAAIGVFVYLANGRDRQRDRRAFLKKLALDVSINPATLVHYQQASDPIQEAVTALVDPETDEPQRLAFRKAVACVL